MTRIAVFCDGTWNAPDIAEPTSIVQLYEALENDPAKGQVAAYFRGIGTTDTFDGPVRRFVSKWGGGAFGWGLDAKVKQAYQFLARAYRPGDEICLFGFSRGAYTARSVAGMIRKCGLAADTSPEGINRAFDLYRTRGPFNQPDKPHVMRARREISPRFATSQEDLAWRDDGSALVDIAYIGVFDTVGARGIPVALFGPVASLWNSRYRFHDTQLSRLVRAARHAIAVDERRIFYAPARWDNLARLNGPAREDDPRRSYQQTWFIGNHGIVGGAMPPAALGVIPQAWVLGGANLALRPGTGPDITAADPLARSIHLPDAGLLGGWRAGPRGGDSVHGSVRARVQGRHDYRPRSLGERLGTWLSG